MEKIFSLFALLFFIPSEAKEIYISLGSHCEVAAELVTNNLREEAYPFDWLVTLNNDLFTQLILEDFEHFLDDQFLFQNPEFPTIIENSYYQIEMRHDWPFPELWTDCTRYALQLCEMNIKYHRRIERFRSLRDYPGKVFFIRSAYDPLLSPTFFLKQEEPNLISQFDAQKLKNALDQYFPKLNFTLIIINYKEDLVPVIEGINGVVEFKISKKTNHKDYQELLALIKSPSTHSAISN